MSTPRPSPFADVTLTALRRRNSLKWATYPADVLPLWVAEMDVAIAEPVARALRDAVGRSDIGYPLRRTHTPRLSPGSPIVDGGGAV